MNQDSENNPEIQNLKADALGWGSEFARDELSAEEQTELMDWLAQHPEESARFHDLQDLVRLCKETCPPEPSELAWSELSAGVLAKMSASALGVSRPGAEPAIPTTSFPHRWLRSSFLGAAAAAAIVLALILRQGKNPDTGPTGPSRGPNANAEAQLERKNEDDLVVLAGDLQIIVPNDIDLVSMEGNDSSLLVVGNPPVSEALVLMKAGDVSVARVDPDVKVHLAADPDSSPMIEVPIRSKESKDPDSK
jgi:hypothetical protein